MVTRRRGEGAINSNATAQIRRQSVCRLGVAFRHAVCCTAWHDRPVRSPLQHRLRHLALSAAIRCYPVHFPTQRREMRRKMFHVKQCRGDDTANRMKQRLAGEGRRREAQRAGRQAGLGLANAPSKASGAMDSIPGGTQQSSSDLQFLKARRSMATRFEGRTTSLSPTHPSKAASSI